MGIMFNRNTCSGKLVLFLVALAVLAGFRSGLAEGQSQAENMEEYEATDPIGRKARIRVPRGATDEEIRAAIDQAIFSFPTGIEQLLKTAEHGDTKAQQELGDMYANGEGVPEDYREAEKWRRQAAEQAEDLDLLSLAVQYANGIGVPEDSWEAKKLFRLVAEGGHPVFAQAAQRQLGDMYYAGKYALQFGKDNREAVKWYRKAAEQGDAKAQERLGHMYANGEGVPQDFVKAHAWMNLAAAQGFQAENRDRLAAQMTPAQIAEAQELATELFKHIESSKLE